MKPRRSDELRNEVKICWLGYAIKIMRDHPLHGKHNLYVQRDVQETGRSQSQRSQPPSLSTLSKGWKFVDKDENYRDLKWFVRDCFVIS